MVRLLLLLPLAACGGTGDTTDSTAGTTGTTATTTGTTQAIECPVDTSQPDVGSIDPACCAYESTLEVGTGSEGFEELPDGSELTMVHGPQGGWHMYGAIRACSTRDVVTINFRITDLVSGVEVSNNDYRVALVPESDCCGVYYNMYGYLDVSELADGDRDTPPELLCGHDLRITMEATDSDGRDLVDERTVRAVPDEQDVDDCIIDPGDPGYKGTSP